MIIMSRFRPDYHNHVSEQLISCRLKSIDFSFLQMLMDQSQQQDNYSKPMPWIGMYIALASFVCILAMVVDLLHGLRHRKLWFPCKYFTLNAASLTVIAVAIKIPMDLNNPMPGLVDQAAKLGSMAFMCTMMANSLPSLAAMDSKELLTNIIALDILVITLIVNVCIQMSTRIFSTDYSLIAASIYVVMLLMLLSIHTSSALTILKSKQHLESKYKTGRQIALENLELQQPIGRLTVEKLKQHVSNHWIMAGTGSPQFISACSATTSASGVICAASTALHIIIMLYVYPYMTDYLSDYKRSMLVILIAQFIGAILGTIAPLSRCFATLSFKMSTKWILNHIKVFKVESYWTQILSDWKHSSALFPSSNRKFKIVIHNLKSQALSFCIGFQKTVVVVCKVISLIPGFFLICVLYFILCWKWIMSMFGTSGIGSVQNPYQVEQKEDLSRYVLQLQDDMELAERTLKGITKSVNHLIRKAEKRQPVNLLKLLQNSRGFEGVKKFDSCCIPPLLSVEHLDCWSLPVITLATIALSLPNIPNSSADTLLSSVSEGLSYVKLVEENLNVSDDYLGTQNAAKMLWLEVEVYQNWLGNKLQKPSPLNTTGMILQWFKNTAKNMVNEVDSMDTRSVNDNAIYRSISANSMYRITETILLSYNTDIEEVSQEELFLELSSMISDILAACLTNLPQVIVMKCHTKVIEKREASVNAAAQLLGQATNIMNILQDRELPTMHPDEFPYIDKWQIYLKPPLP